MRGRPELISLTIVLGVLLAPGAVLVGLLAPTFLILAAVVGWAVVISRPALIGATLAAVSLANAASVLTEFHGVLSITEPLLVLALVAAGLEWKRTGVAPTNPSPFTVLAFAGYVAVVIASALWAQDRSAAEEAAAGTLRDAVIALVVIASIRTAKDVELVVTGIVAVGSVLALAGVHQVATGNYGSDYGGFAQASIEQIVGRLDSWRIKGPFDDPNFYAQAMVVVFALALGIAVAGRSPTHRIFGGLGAVASAAAVILSFSRGGLLGLVAVLIASVIVRPPKPVTALTAAVSVLAVAALLPASYLDRIGESVQGLPLLDDNSEIADAAVRGRTSEAIVGAQIFLDHPVRGVGVANYPDRYQEYSRVVGLDPRREDRQPHNLYLEVASETGLVGMVAFGVILAGVFTSLVRSRRRGGEFRTLSDTMFPAVIGLLTTGVFLHASYARTMWVLFAISMSVGVVARTTRPSAITDVPDRVRETA